MLSATAPNKLAHIFRRFMEGWFSVFLFIFVVTLLIRIFLFQGDTSITQAHGAQSGVTVKAHEIMHKSIVRVVNSTKLQASNENQLSFVDQELTSK